ncbi:MAG: hypothetical protein EXQ47_00005 [Bryobacterales bacterium]|nr:hypothetical protein [Bryobacterales bacterium]
MQNLGTRKNLQLAARLALAYYCAALVVMVYGLWKGHALELPGFLMGFASSVLVVRRYSRIAVEIGWVGIGSLLLGILCSAAWAAGGNVPWAVAAAIALGMASGLCLLPLFAYRGIASRPAFAVLGVLCGAAIPAAPMSRGALLLWVGVATLAFTAGLFAYEKEFMIRSGLFLGGRVISGIRVVGQHHVPASGGVLLVSNHVTFIDGFLIGSSLPRLVRYMIWKPYFELPVANWVCRTIEAIPMSETGPREVVASLRRAREKLGQGEVVCIFAEGFITRNGEMLPFKRGMEKIVHGLDVPIIPVHLDGLAGRTLSFLNGKLVYRWPQWGRQPVTISFGPALAARAGAGEAQRAVEELAMAAAQWRGR